MKCCQGLTQVFCGFTQSLQQVLDSVLIRLLPLLTALQFIIYVAILHHIGVV